MSETPAPAPAPAPAPSPSPPPPAVPARAPVPGTIQVDASGSFTATFVVNTISHKYEGTVAPTPGPFICDSARLEFTVTNDLTNPRKLTGYVGPALFQLNLENGPIIKGSISPSIGAKTNVEGNGAWSS